MQYRLNELPIRRELARYWEQTIQGQTLRAVYCGMEYFDVRCFEDAIVLRTDHVDIAILTDMTGGRVEIGRFPQVPAEVTYIWSIPAQPFREWPLEGITGHVLGPISLGMTTMDGGYT